MFEGGLQHTKKKAALDKYMYVHNPTTIGPWQSPQQLPERYAGWEACIRRSSDFILHHVSMWMGHLHLSPNFIVEEIWRGLWSWFLWECSWHGVLAMVGNLLQKAHDGWGVVAGILGRGEGDAELSFFENRNRPSGCWFARCLKMTWNPLICSVFWKVHQKWCTFGALFSQTAPKYTKSTPHWCTFGAILSKSTPKVHQKCTFFVALMVTYADKPPLCLMYLHWCVHVLVSLLKSPTFLG